MRFKNELMMPWMGISGSGTGRFFKDVFSGCDTSSQLPANFRVDVEDKGDFVVLTADLPGMSKSDISITLEEGVLTISGERHQEGEVENRNHSISERKFGKFIRSFDISGIDESSINAALTSGVLTVTLNKAAETKAQKIEIK